ncbi:MAG: transposase [Candidatus Berkelbacteria bacterium]|nr:transposase [Candidatus Berkelbacteria bacterium]
MTQMREDLLVRGEYYHIFSRSIAKFVVFNNSKEYSRMLNVLRLYQFSDFDYKYSKFIELDISLQNSIWSALINKNKRLVEIMAYCIMPTHFHLILKQIADDGISRYLSKVLNSYTRYFNLRHKRIGPLWSGRFKNVLISDDEQLLHLTRYIHLNPVSAKLTDKPEDWKFSSCNEYFNVPDANGICIYNKIIDMDSSRYKNFVLDNIDYQKELSKIKRLLMEDYTG